MRREGQEEEIDQEVDEEDDEIERCVNIYSGALDAFVKHVEYELSRNRWGVDKKELKRMKGIINSIIEEHFMEDVLG